MHMDWLENESNHTNWTSDRPGISLTDPKRCLQYHVVSSCTRYGYIMSRESYIILTPQNQRNVLHSGHNNDSLYLKGE